MLKSKNQIVKEQHILLFPPFFWLIVFFVAPLLIIVVYSFCQKGLYGGVKFGFTTEAYRAALGSDLLYMKILLNSLYYAALTTVITILFAYPLAYYMAFTTDKMKNILMFLIILPFWTNFLIKIPGHCHSVI